MRKKQAIGIRFYPFILGVCCLLVWVTQLYDGFEAYEETKDSNMTGMEMLVEKNDFVKWRQEGCVLLN